MSVRKYLTPRDRSTDERALARWLTAIVASAGLAACTDPPCQPPTMRIGGVCSTPCDGGSGALCEPDSGMVLTRDAQVDAAGDASTVDASRMDASGTDASGMDAGGTDAGGVDAPADAPADVLGCDAGAIACELLAPRQLAPLSTATVTTQRPTLHWTLASGTDGATAEVCSDRAFTRECQRVDATGTSAAVPAALHAGVWFWRLHGRSGSTVGTRTGPVWQFTAGARSAPVDSSNGTVLDFNGDGYADVVVGAPYELTGGRVHVYLGSAAGLSSTAALDLAGAVADGTDSGFGGSVASAGDVNGDGYADLVVGAERAMINAGRAYVYLGSAAGLSSTPAVDLPPPAADGPRGQFGGLVASAGDVNGDGYADVLVGAFRPLNFAGRVHVYLGSAAGLSSTSVVDLEAPAADGANSYFGMAMDSAGDVNADGYADVLVGAYGAPGGGRAHVYLGSAAGLSSTAAVDLAPPAADDSAQGFGGSVASAGDVNGDGYADVLVGAQYAMGGAGRAHVYLGSAAGLSSIAAVDLAPPAADGTGALFGDSTASAGDVNGDGYADLVVGASAAMGGAGRAHVYLGSAAGLSSTAAVDLAPPAADGTDGQFGAPAVSAGDVNGDGFADLLVGAYWVMSRTGRAHVYLGSAAGLSSTSAVDLAPPAGDGSFAYFGFSVASAGKVRSRSGAAHAVTALPLRAAPPASRSSARSASRVHST